MKIPFKNILSIISSALVFGFIKYMIEKEFTVSLVMAALLFGLIFEIFKLCDKERCTIIK